jgi:alpha-amylase
MDIEKLNSYYTTEEQGYKLHIFPISQKMRYFIPFQNVESTIDYFKYLVRENPHSDPVVVMADDGEKFGLWPSTYKHVYENGWLERFLTALEENSDIVETVSFSDVLKTKSSAARVYLPCASYFEMSEWSLPSEEQQSFENVLNKYGGDNEAKRFLRGGFWRNFLTKYEESNNMHKKMLYVSKKIEKYVESKKPLSEIALDNLYAGQCNCAYWHGVFGGLYLPHLRNAVYSSLLKAENIYNKSMLKRDCWRAVDFNYDSADEYLFESKTQNIYVSPSSGGSIFEWDILKINHNILDVLTKRYESYHKKIKDNINNVDIASDEESEAQTIHSGAIRIKEPGIDKFLVYDKYRRASLIDHFFTNDIRHDNCMFGYYEDQGDFVSGTYSAEVKGNSVILSRLGKVCGRDIAVRKTISPVLNGYKVLYEIKNQSYEILDACFAPEQIFAFSSKTGDDFADLKEVEIWKRWDEHFKIEVEIKFSHKSDLFIYPVETVSNSDNGYERTYQGTAAVALVRGEIQPGETKQFSFETGVNLTDKK